MNILEMEEDETQTKISFVIYGFLKLKIDLFLLHQLFHYSYFKYLIS